MLNRASYKTEELYNEGLKAWNYLDKAIESEEKGEMGKARMSLAMACSIELKALGFTSADFTSELDLTTAAGQMKTIAHWTKPTSVPTVH